MRTLICITTWLAASAAHAHDGHGLSSGLIGHWHATDTWGWIAAACVALALWLGRK
jgi:hypothetical protein